MNDNYLTHHGVKGMKWGVRRYQNSNGSLTPAGRKRYDRDIADNLGKKKDNRIDTSKPDPHRWVREDLERKRRLVDTGSSMVKQLQNLEKETMDLSKMSDKELRDRINRELLEQQYNKLFSEIEQPTISKGRQIVSNVLSVSGSALAVTGSALAIALSIKELRGK